MDADVMLLIVPQVHAAAVVLMTQLIPASVLGSIPVPAFTHFQ